jgi:Spy/CpxP family protein refolding chaperone
MKYITMIGLMAVLVCGCGHKGGDTEQERRQIEDKRRQVEDQHRRIEDDRRRAEDERRRIEDERRRAVDAALEASKTNGGEAKP